VKGLLFIQQISTNMPSGGARKNTGGARPGAGRPSLLKSEQLAALSMRCVELTKAYIDDESIPLRDRVDVFSRIAVKVMPQDINLGGQADNPVNVISLQWEK